ncbi:carbohydate-binding domain-containing protein [Zooshikella marina]|uniref:family 20 glycosylhydrolase n=1 Tax=Zooshikella ganghwensis TaxID=202772 RepID=UPI001BAFF366|nr:family 20 glycosylhydrolase [Zooshikella ganghwensis]MBU2708180.1 carbohydate-binding domain-containing protein [Zooshikella ganghwensis]
MNIRANGFIECLKKYEYILKALFIIIPLSFLSLSTSADNSNIKNATDDISIHWQVIDNLQDSANSFTAKLTIKNNGSQSLTHQNWRIYFNFVREILAYSPNDTLSIKHVNGDLFYIEPKSRFTGISIGEALTVQLTAQYWAISKSDAPAGFYLVPSKNSQPILINDVVIADHTSDKQTKRFDGDRWPVDTAEVRFDRNRELLAIDTPILANNHSNSTSLVIPSPAEVQKTENQQLMINQPITIAFSDEFRNEAEYLRKMLTVELDWPVSFAKRCEYKPFSICLINQPTINQQSTKIVNDGYELTIDKLQGINIYAEKPAGIFYGIQTLLGLAPVENYLSNTVKQETHRHLLFPVMHIKDYPRFEYRGVHLDVARHFSSLVTVKRLIDVLALYKLNKLHLHLTDDEGWRIAILGLPELTDVGGRRGHTLDEVKHLVPSFGSGPFPDSNNGSGFYTREEFIELLRYAQRHHVTVIPEIDFPGHARAAIKSMEARYARLQQEGLTDQAARFLLSDLQDMSVYKSVQGWHDNVINPCLSSTYLFINKILAELHWMYQEAGVEVPVIHLGGDEVPEGVWRKSPACTALYGGTEELSDQQVERLKRQFVYNVHQMVQVYRKQTGGWEELAFAKDDDSVIINPMIEPGSMRPYVWNNVWGWGTEDYGYRLANAGFPVVLANATNLYFDLAYQKDPDELGYYWAGFVNARTVFEFTPFDIFKSAWQDRMGNSLNDNQWENSTRLQVDKRNNILGIQGQLWSENIKSAEQLEYLALPKLIALAERAWANQPTWADEQDRKKRFSKLNQHWQQFALRMGSYELPRLDRWQGGYHYRLPLPGAKLVGGKIHANTAFPGLTIRYTIDGSEPSLKSQKYQQPFDPVAGQIKLKTFSTNGRSSRTTVLSP